MERRSVTRGRQVGIALAAIVALSVLGIASARAAATFASGNITVNSVGFLECAFKESGLVPGAMVNYTCGAADVGWVTQCFVRNKPASGIAVSVHVAHAADGLITTQDRTVGNQGSVTSSILTAYPTAEAEVGLQLCPETEGVEITEEITAIRWCNASLADTTNGIPGAAVPELFLQLERNGSAAVPSCAQLRKLPSDF